MGGEQQGTGCSNGSESSAHKVASPTTSADSIGEAGRSAAAAANLAAAAATRRARRGGPSFVMEGLEVDWFAAASATGRSSELGAQCDDVLQQGQVQDEASHVQAPVLLAGSWMFRGPLDVERKLLLSSQRQAAAAASSMALAAEHAVQMARRGEREAQLQELLAWMTAYQQQWSAAMGHVQKAITRQQERLQDIRSRHTHSQGDGQQQEQQPLQQHEPAARGPADVEQRATGAGGEQGEGRL